MLKPEIQAAMNAIEEHLKSINEILDKVREESGKDEKWFSNKEEVPPVIPNGYRLQVMYRDWVTAEASRPLPRECWTLSGLHTDIIKYRFI